MQQQLQLQTILKCEYCNATFTEAGKPFVIVGEIFCSYKCYNNKYCLEEEEYTHHLE